MRKFPRPAVPELMPLHAAGEEFDLLANTSLRCLHVRNLDPGSANSLVTILRQRVCPANLVNLALDLYIPTPEALDFLAGLLAEVDTILVGSVFSSLQSVTVWLRVIPAASSPRALLNVVEGWMPVLRSRSILHTKPWWNLGFHISPSESTPTSPAWKSSEVRA